MLRLAGAVEKGAGQERQVERQARALREAVRESRERVANTY